MENDFTQSYSYSILSNLFNFISDFEKLPTKLTHIKC